MMPRVRRLCAIAFACSVLSRPATGAAQSPQPAPPATIRVEIPAGPLAAALRAFQSATGTLVTFSDPSALDGLVSPGVSGEMTPAQALERLLAGTGLVVRRRAADHFVISIQPHTEVVQVRGVVPAGGTTLSTATRTQTPLRDVPQAVTLVPAAMIAEQGMQSMADVVRYAPGVQMAQGEGNRDAPVLRGHATTGDFFVDGMRDDVQYFRDLYNAERVEVLKGPNAMIFGRGGAGGVINRATKQADWSAARTLTLQAGSYDNRRATVDLNHAVTAAVAARLTGVYEDSGSYRRGVTLGRYGINPTVSWAAGAATLLKFGFERFHDARTADRGVPSFNGRPLSVSRSTFFGDPDLSRARVTTDSVAAALEHGAAQGLQVRSRIRYAHYDKFYQNVYPGGAVSADGRSVPIAAYNNATARRNLFNQTDLTFPMRTGKIAHTALVGIELGRQVTDNVRHTGFFPALGPNVTTFPAAVAQPTISVPVAFRPGATDADNHGVATVAAVYVQDQVALSAHVQTVVGLRFDRFAVDVIDNRTQAQVASRDALWSPRVGLIYKPVEAASAYASYSIAFVPRAGDQLASLTLSNRALAPERFVNYELGVKWDLRPSLAATAAVYQLDRANVAVPDPADSTRSLLVNGQRSRGVEASLVGTLTEAWHANVAWARQEAVITHTLSAGARAGARLSQVPSTTLAIWSRYDFTPRVGAAVGIVHSGAMYASTDNTVELPAFTRVDAALFVAPAARFGVQVNAENLLDARYWASAHNNNNLTPGAPRTVRVSLVTRF